MKMWLLTVLYLTVGVSSTHAIYSDDHNNATNKTSRRLRNSEERVQLFSTVKLMRDEEMRSSGENVFSSEHHFNFSKNLTKFIPSPEFHSQGWLPKKPNEILSRNLNLQKNISQSPTFKTKLPRKNFTRVNLSNIGVPIWKSFRNSRALSFPGSNFHRAEAGKNDTNTAKMVLQTQKSLHSSSASPRSEVIDHLFINGIKMPAQNGALPVRSLDLSGTVTPRSVNRVDLKISKVHSDSSDLDFGKQKVTVTRVNKIPPKLFTQEFKKTSKSHVPDLKNAFEDFSNNIMTMFPIERRGEIASDVTESFVVPEYSTQDEAGVHGAKADEQSTALTEVRYESAEDSSEKFLAMWHENFGSSAANSHRVAYTPSQSFDAPSTSSSSSGILSINQPLKSYRTKKFTTPDAAIPHIKHVSSKSSSRHFTHHENSDYDSFTAPNIVYRYDEPIEEYRSVTSPATPAGIESVIHHMKDSIHGDMKTEFKVERQDNLFGTYSSTQFGDNFSNFDEPLVGKSNNLDNLKQQWLKQEPLPVYEDYRKENPLDYLVNLSNRLRKNMTALRWENRISQHPLRSNPVVFNEAKYLPEPNFARGKIITAQNSQNWHDTEKNTISDPQRDENNFGEGSMKASQDGSWENLFSTHFLSPNDSKRRETTFRSAFRVVDGGQDLKEQQSKLPLSMSLDGNLEEYAPALNNSPSKSLDSINSNFRQKGTAMTRLHINRDRAFPVLTAFDKSPWKPASPLAIPALIPPKVGHSARLGRTTSSTTTTARPKSILYHTDQITTRSIKVRRKFPQLSGLVGYRKANDSKPKVTEENYADHSSFMHAKKSTSFSSKKKSYKQSWPSRLFNYVTKSFFGNKETKSNSIAYKNYTENRRGNEWPTEYLNVSGNMNRRQKWPSTDRISSEDEPVVGTKEYLTVTAVAALGTLTSMILFSLNNPFAGRGAPERKLRPDPHVEQTLKFLVDAASEYDNFTASSHLKPYPRPMATSDIIYSEHRISEEYLDEMLNSINAKHTVNMKNNLALFVLNAYRLLKKYPSDTGINKLLRRALEIYRKIKYIWTLGTNTITGKGETSQGNKWVPLSEEDKKKVITLLREIKELKVFKNLTELPINDLQSRTMSIESNHGKQNLITDETATTLPILEVPTYTLPQTSVLNTSTEPPTALRSQYNKTINISTSVSQFPSEALHRRQHRTNLPSKNDISMPVRSSLLLLPPNADRELSVAPITIQELLKFNEDNERSKRVIFNKRLQNSIKTYRNEDFETAVGVINPLFDEISEPSGELAHRGVFINNKLHSLSDGVLLNSDISR